MNTILAPRITGAAARRGMSLTVLALLLAVIAFSHEGYPAQADDGPGSISLLYIDMDTSGNSINAPIDTDADTVADTEATSLGPAEDCVSITGTGTTDIDIVVADWPDSGEQLVGYDITLNYDPAVVRVTGLEYGATPLGTLISADPQSGGLANFGDFVFPDDDGALVVSVMDIGGPFDPDEDVDGEETSPGFLARITLQGVATGQSTLTLSTPGALILTEEALGSYVAVDQVNNGFVSVNQPCVPGSQPGPTPPPVPPPFCSNGADSDGDGFSDCIEVFVGTDAAKDCAATGTQNDEGPPDAWPVDANDDQLVNILEFLLMKPHLTTYDARFDLNTDSAGNLLDALPLKIRFFNTCTPSSAATIVVNSTGDADIRDGVLTLREAILLATGVLPLGNLDGGEAGNVTGTPGAASPDTITFDGEVFSPGTITLTSALPDLSTDIDTVDGSGADVTVDGVPAACFTISSNANTIKGIDLIVNCSTGVYITGAANTIGGVNVDNDADGLFNEDLPDTVDNDGDTLVDEDPLEGGMVIGPNVVGVDISGASATGNTVKGNHIGAYSPFNDKGVRIQAGAQNNTVGGTTAGERNVISGNNGGVFITDSGTNGNSVKGNYIGPDAAGSDPPATQPGGVRIQSGAQNNTIGGVNVDNDADGLYNEDPSDTVDNDGDTVVDEDPLDEGNVISGNHVDGLVITGTNTNGNTVSGNYIGPDAAGTAAVGNDRGVVISSDATGNTIGGDTAGKRNAISGNTTGVEITASGNTVKGNYIGTNAAGDASIPNNVGVMIDGGAQNNTIGGDTAADRNVISGNTSNGVQIGGAGTDGNTVSGNYIGTNADGNDDVANGADGVVIDGGASGNTIGGDTAGERNVISGNSAGSGVMIVADGNFVEGNYVGTNAAGTSALANSWGVALAAAVGNTIGGSLTGQGNLISGNTNFGVDIGPGANGNTVKGNYIGTDYIGTSPVANGVGVHIDGGAQSNTIGGTSEGGRNVISGNSGNGVEIQQPATTGNTVKGNYIGTDKNGTAYLGNGVDGVRINDSSGNTVGGTAAGAGNVISGNTYNGVRILAGGTLNDIQGNYIGIDKNGTAYLGNGEAGVAIYDSDSNTVGGTAGGAGNVLSGNGWNGVRIGNGSTLNEVQGNFIGTDRNGTADRGNDEDGVRMDDADSNLIGGTTAAARNVISGNGWGGVRIAVGGTLNEIQGNYIGADISGNSALANDLYGVRIENSPDNTVGGTASGEANTIAFNTGDGVRVVGATSTGNSIRGNSIHSNTGLGIDLGGDGVTPNDGDDSDDGPNHLMNFPENLSATFDGVYTTIEGTLANTPNPDLATVDVYATDAADPTGYGEGRAYVGSTTPNVLGDWDLVVSGFPPYATFTATATSPNPSTSEFSQALPPSPGPGLPITKIARTGDDAPAPTNGQFVAFGPARVPNTEGHTVFWASVTDGNASEGIFRWDADTELAETVVDLSDTPPIGSAYTALGQVPIMNEGNSVVFWAEIDAATEGIFLAQRPYSDPGAVTAVAVTGDGTPAGGTYVSFLNPNTWRTNPPIINNDGDISFWATLSVGGQGIFLTSPSYVQPDDATAVAVTGGGAPVGGVPDVGTFSGFVAAGGWATIPIVTNNRQVSFWGEISGAGSVTEGVFVYTEGDLRDVVVNDPGQATPLGGTYLGFAHVPSPNDSGQVAFWASLSGSSADVCTASAAECAVFMATDGVISEVVAAGDTGPAGVGGTISDVRSIALINGSAQLTVWTEISNGLSDQSVVRITNGVVENVAAVGNPEVEPAPGTFHSFIDASNEGTVSAPNNLGQVAFWGKIDVAGPPYLEGIFVTKVPTGPVIERAVLSGKGAPGGGIYDPNFDLDISEDGAAVFHDTVSNPASSGIFRFFSGSPEVEVARQLDPAPVGGNFTSFGPPVSSQDYVVAWGETDGAIEGIFSYRFYAGSWVAEEVVTNTDTAPGFSPSRFFSGFAADVSINASSRVAAKATWDDDWQALYRFYAGSPGTSDVLAKGHPVDGDNAPGFGGARFFTGFGVPAISDREDVVAKAILDDTTQALYRFFAGLPVDSAQKIALEGESAPDTSRFFAGFADRPGISPDSKVAFKATLTGTPEIEALFVHYPDWPVPAERLQLLAKEGDAAPTEIGGTYAGFGEPVINGYGQVVARAMIDNGVEVEALIVFSKKDPSESVEAKKIALEGEPSPDGPDYGKDAPEKDVFPFYAYSDAARVVYVANLVDGDQGVYIGKLDNDGDRVLDFMDNCPDHFNTKQNNTDRALAAGGVDVVGDELGNACDDDDDGDGLCDPGESSTQCSGSDACPVDPNCDDDDLMDHMEVICGSDPTDANSVPERVDGTFNGVDDDGNDGADESLPSGAEGYDCDRDGYVGSDESHLYDGSSDRDQDPCGNDGWPSDLFSSGASENKIDLQDMGSFVAPVPRLGTSPGDAFFDVRWDLNPGPNFPFPGEITLSDMGTLLTGTQGNPPMFDNEPAFRAVGAPTCPWPP